jgi:hypothetical protein
MQLQGAEPFCVVYIVAHVGFNQAKPLLVVLLGRREDVDADHIFVLGEELCRMHQCVPTLNVLFNTTREVVATFELLFEDA